jgi:hypothetical protein
MAEHCILAVFILEMAAKLWSQRRAYFESGWHVFDVVVIALSLLPMLPQPCQLVDKHHLIIRASRADGCPSSRHCRDSKDQRHFL